MNVQFALQVFVAALATVGIEEYLKNFFKPKNTVWYAVLMLPLSAGCFLAIYLLPIYVIGIVLTSGCVQLCYQTLIQGFKSIVSTISKKIEKKADETAIPTTTEGTGK